MRQNVSGSYRFGRDFRTSAGDIDVTFPVQYIPERGVFVEMWLATLVGFQGSFQLGNLWQISPPPPSFHPLAIPETRRDVLKGLLK